MKKILTFCLFLSLSNLAAALTTDTTTNPDTSNPNMPAPTTSPTNPNTMQPTPKHITKPF